MTAAYSNPLASKSRNSNPSAPRRNSVRSHTAETLSLMRESLVPKQRIPQLSAAQAGAVAATLDDLVEMGLLETFVDEHRITRYRPSGGRVA